MRSNSGYDALLFGEKDRVIGYDAVLFGEKNLVIGHDAVLFVKLRRTRFENFHKSIISAS